MFKRRHNDRNTVYICLFGRVFIFRYKKYVGKRFCFDYWRYSGWRRTRKCDPS